MHSVIPFKHVEPLEFEDLWTEEGAKRLAARIFNYWLDRGHVVQPRVERNLLARGPERGRANRSREPIWCVRSDMINGLPRGMAEDAGAS